MSRQEATGDPKPACPGTAPDRTYSRAPGHLGGGRSAGPAALLARPVPSSFPGVCEDGPSAPRRMLPCIHVPLSHWGPHSLDTFPEWGRRRSEETAPTVGRVGWDRTPRRLSSPSLWNEGFCACAGADPQRADCWASTGITAFGGWSKCIVGEDTTIPGVSHLGGRLAPQTSTGWGGGQDGPAWRETVALRQQARGPPAWRRFEHRVCDMQDREPSE